MLLNEQPVVIFAKPKISPLWSISLRYLAGKWRQIIPEFAKNASKCFGPDKLVSGKIGINSPKKDFYLKKKACFENNRATQDHEKQLNSLGTAKSIDQNHSSALVSSALVSSALVSSAR